MNEKKTNGFTLIELLAVIILLAVIALIAIPSVINLINEGIKKSFVNSVHGVIKAGDLYYSSKDLMDEFEEEVIFEFPNNIEGLEIKGKIPESGKMKIDENGDITLAVTNGRYCVRKILDREELVVNENIENCILPVTLSEVATTSEELGITTIDNCMLNGVCEPGTPFAINVNDNETYKFYVTEDNGDEITLIMSENLGENVSWTSSAFVSSGPTVVLKNLEERTDGWLNIPKRNYKVVDDSGFDRFKSIDTHMRSRLLTYIEIIPFCERYCPNYLQGYYWLSSANSDNEHYFASYINGKHIGLQHASYSAGVRPVITLLANKKQTSLVTNLELEFNDITTVSNSPFTMKTTVSPTEANNKKLKWSSTDSSVVIVDETGLITGISGGSAKIYVETTDGSNIKKEINITINESKKLSELAITSETLQVTEINSCVNNGICEPGTPFAIKVNDSEIYKFYVIEDDGIDVTLIMGQNLSQKSAWGKTNYNSSGPLVILDSLKSQTASWTNIPIRVYNLEDDVIIPIYPSMTIVESRARLLTETETKKLGCTSSSCPEYLLSAEEYWLSTSNAETAYAYMINSTGLIHAYYTTNSRGVRPVITVPKN